MDCLLERSYHLQMHTPTAVEHFSLGSFRSVCKWDMTKLNSKLTQMNCITMHKCTEMYSSLESVTGAKRSREDGDINEFIQSDVPSK